MFTYMVGSSSGVGFSELREGDYFKWHQFHVKDWGAQDFEGHGPVTLNNRTGRAVPITWILLGIQSMV